MGAISVFIELLFFFLLSKAFTRADRAFYAIGIIELLLLRSCLVEFTTLDVDSLFEILLPDFRATLDCYENFGDF